MFVINGIVYSGEPKEEITALKILPVLIRNPGAGFRHAPG